ncbi:hypothetical protein JR338_07460 [Chloroflexota bacterium]|nr:hypothetical protein JR338_07460 [Chloroflexota bacterium]
MSNAPLYTVITLAEALQDPATRDWLLSTGVSLPDDLPPGKDTAPLEMQAILEGISGLRIVYKITATTWQASITSRKDVSWASLRFTAFTGDLELPQKYCFDGGWDEVILLIASRVARHSGPLVLLHDSGAAPQVVY